MAVYANIHDSSDIATVIDELITQQTEEYKIEIADLEGEVEKRDETIDNLNDEIERLKEQIRELEDATENAA